MTEEYMTLLENGAKDALPDLIKQALNHGVNINTLHFSDRGLTALHFAIEKDNLEIVKFLIEECNANLETEDSFHATPLCTAVWWGRFSIARYLVEKGANITVSSDKNPLRIAIERNNSRIINYLLSRNIDVNLVDSQGDTPLSFALKSNQAYKNLAKALIKKGARITEGRNMFAAVENNRLDFIKEHIADVNVLDTFGNSFLAYAAGLGKMEILNYLLQNNADVDRVGGKGKTPLIAAAKENKSNIVKLLVHQGANINFVDPDGNTALSHVAGRKDPLKMVELLVDLGADPCKSGTGGKKPLQMAALRKNLETAKFLIENGAGFTVQSALTSASEGGSLEIVKLLIKEGARPTSADFMLSMKRGFKDIVKFFVEEGAHKNLTDKDTTLEKYIKDGDLEMIQYLLKKGFDPRDVQQVALTVGNVEIISELREKGVDFSNIPDKEKKELLLDKIRKRDFSMVKFLVEEIHVSPRFIGNEGLAETVRQDHLKMFKYLLGKGEFDASHSEELLLVSVRNKNIGITLLLLEKTKVTKKDLVDDLAKFAEEDEDFRTRYTGLGGSLNVKAKR